MSPQTAPDLPAGLPPRLAALQQQLAASASPVERDIALLLAGGWADAAAAHRLQRYHRKIDVAHRLMAAYDARIEQATSPHTASGAACLGLAWVFLAAAQRAAAAGAAGQADRLRWLNSVLNCLDQVDRSSSAAPQAGLLADLESALQPLLAEVART